MARFNDTSFVLLLKQGLYANLIKLTTLLLPGEMVYTTDTRQLFVSDGTNQMLVNPATVQVNFGAASTDSEVAVNQLDTVNGWVSPITVNTPPKFVPNHAILVNLFPLSDDYSVSVNAAKPITVNGV